MWNYEAPQGTWASSEDSGATIDGGFGFTAGMLPPFGGWKAATASLADKTAFLSDVINASSSSNRSKLTGGAPYNHRIRYQIKLDKIIGTEGVTGFHPITNHVDENGIANIKRGPMIYSTNAVTGHITTAKGGTPGNETYYNLSSYWNHSAGAGDGKTLQPDDINNSFYDNEDGCYIGLHERGLNETTIEVVTRYTGRDRDFPISNNPAIWETEPKEDVGLDIFYAASPSFPLDIKRYRWDANFTGPDFKTGSDELDPSGANWYDFAYRGEELVKVGSKVSVVNVSGYTSLGPEGEDIPDVRVCTVQGDMIWLSNPFTFDGTTPVILPIGTKLRIKWQGEGAFYGANHDEEYVEVWVTATLSNIIYRIGNDLLHSSTGRLKHGLSYYNCYSYGTGVETNRVRDDYNAVTLDKGVKASMPLAEQYKEERKSSSLIFSGIYNSTSGINRTNQFIQAEPITKDLNPINGSIQKLFTRDTDLVTFCENKVFKILAQKDALFNADGNTNVTSNAAVLGQSIPFSGEYGISKNPESFASESYRLYFSDKARGAVLRLSRDGLTPISDAGMKDWFRDNLRFASKLIGSHDDREGQYNLTIETADQNNNSKAYTVSYAEKSKGWVSFKSFIQQGGISHKNIYYTFPSNTYNAQLTNDPWGVNYGGGSDSNAEIYQHNLDVELNRLTVSNVNGLGTFSISDGVGTILRGMSIVGDGIPIDTIVASITGCNGTTCSITLSFTNNSTTGVYLTTNTQLTFRTNRNTFYDNPDRNYSMVKVMFNGAQGSVKRFKTLNYEGSQSRVLFGDVAGLNHQIVEGVTFGQEYYDNHPKLGWYVENIFTDLQDGNMNDFIDKENKWFNYIKGKVDAMQGDFLDSGEFSLQGLGYLLSAPIMEYGCMDEIANNYDPLATVDDGSCTYPISGCMNPESFNYNQFATEECQGCCVPYIWGCMDPTATNYNDTANSDSGECMYVIPGCTDPLATNYDPTATEDDGSCILCVYGCTEGSAVIGNQINSNYDPNATCDDGSCIPCVYGCTIPGMVGYDIWNTCDDGSCTACDYGCTDPSAVNYDPSATCDDGSCITSIYGCTDPLACNWNGSANVDDGSCLTDYGCTDPLACNYDPLATCDDGNCILPDGCTDPLADNYDPAALCDDGSCTYPVSGCMDPEAANYDDTAVIMNGNCEYYGCLQSNANNYGNFYYLNDQDVTSTGTPNPPAGATIIDYTFTDNLGVTWTYEFSDITSDCYDWGCNSSACGGVAVQPPPFQAGGNAGAAVPWTSGDLPVPCCYIEGCTDVLASDYDALANVDDGSCTYPPGPVSGCTLFGYSNYNPAATVNDGSCCDWGCTDNTQCAYPPSNPASTVCGTGNLCSMEFTLVHRVLPSMDCDTGFFGANCTDIDDDGTTNDGTDSYISAHIAIPDSTFYGDSVNPSTATMPYSTGTYIGPGVGVRIISMTASSFWGANAVVPWDYTNTSGGMYGEGVFTEYDEFGSGITGGLGLTHTMYYRGMIDGTRGGTNLGNTPPVIYVNFKHLPAISGQVWQYKMIFYGHNGCETEWIFNLTAQPTGYAGPIDSSTCQPFPQIADQTDLIFFVSAWYGASNGGWAPNGCTLDVADNSWSGEP